MDYKVPGTPYALVKSYFLSLPTLYLRSARRTSPTPKIAIYAAMSTSGRTNSLMRDLPSLPKSCQKPLSASPLEASNKIGARPKIVAEIEIAIC